MTRILLIFILLFTFNVKAQNDSIPQTPEQQKKAINLAVKWTTLLTEGKHVDSLMNISTVPFALDRKKFLNSNDELKSFYLEVINLKGERELPKTTAEVYASKYEIIEKCIPINVLIIKIELIIDDSKSHTILVSVVISGNEMKVIGFSD